jgi:cold shock CspA family protein
MLRCGRLWCARSSVETPAGTTLARVDRWLDAKGYGFAYPVDQSTTPKGQKQRSPGGDRKGDTKLFIHKTQLVNVAALTAGQLVAVENGHAKNPPVHLLRRAAREWTLRGNRSRPSAPSDAVELAPGDFAPKDTQDAVDELAMAARDRRAIFHT